MYVCPDCFSDKGLQRRLVEIRPDQPEARCDFHPTKKGMAIERVSEIVDPVFRDNYYGHPVDAYAQERGSSFDDVLIDLTGVDDDRIVRALMNQLEEADSYWPPDGEEPFYSEDYRYFRADYQPAFGEPARLWTDFRQSLLHGERFFNINARDKIARIFQDVHQQRDTHRQGPVYLIDPSEPQASFLRARIANDEGARREIEADIAGELGPPPERRRRAGRLNPAGVLAFYGAFDMETCVAELRPSVGSVVVGARFKITEPICVLDMTRFAAKPKAPDLYARHARDRMAQWSFMQTFMREIAQPISPDDEHLDYLPTQALAEYLVKHHLFKFAGRERTIDAIIYGSAQNPEGKNIVLLGAAAVVGPTAGASPTSGMSVLKDRERGQAWKLRRREFSPVRIVPVAESLEKRKVMGARFSTAEHYDPTEVVVGDGVLAADEF